MTALVQIVAGCLGTLGFSILFHIRGRKLVFSTLGGLISWTVFLGLGGLLPGESVRYLITAAIITVYGEILARREKTPTTTFLVPSVIPLIPGGALYYTMNYALNEQWSEFARQAFYTLELALSLAVGIIAVTTVVRLLSVWTAKRKKQVQASRFHHSIK